jgi:hypothetical protein
VRRAPPSRATALLLAALFIGGVGGASDLDALLFHGAGVRAAVAGPHFEPGGTTDHHADNCLLTFRVANGRGAAPLSFPVRFEGIPQNAAPARPAPAPQTFLPGLHQESRAPPSSLA